MLVHGFADKVILTAKVAAFYRKGWNIYIALLSKRYYIYCQRAIW